MLLVRSSQVVIDTELDIQKTLHSIVTAVTSQLAKWQA